MTIKCKSVNETTKTVTRLWSLVRRTCYCEQYSHRYRKHFCSAFQLGRNVADNGLRLSWNVEQNIVAMLFAVIRIDSNSLHCLPK